MCRRPLSVFYEQRRVRYRLLDGALIRLALTFTGQSFVKYLLTEGDKLIMATISSSYDQGVYALVSNYGSVKEESSFQLILRMSSHSKNSGSLIVRIVFLPLEESSRMLFSKLMQVRTNTAEAAIRCAKLIALTIKCNLYLGVLLLVGCLEWMCTCCRFDRSASRTNCSALRSNSLRQLGIWR